MNTTPQVPTVPCPTCGRSVLWLPENRCRPFCSERCRLIDLGAWAAEDYKMAAQESTPNQDDLLYPPDP